MYKIYDIRITQAITKGDVGKPQLAPDQMRRRRAKRSMRPSIDMEAGVDDDDDPSEISTEGVFSFVDSDSD